MKLGTSIANPQASEGVAVYVHQKVMACCWSFQAVSKLKPKAKAEISAPSGPLKEMVDLEACSLRVLQEFKHG